MRRGSEFDVQSVDLLRLQMPAIKEPNDEDDMLTGTTSARTARDASYGAGASNRERWSIADTDTRPRPRGRGSTVERCLHDRPRPKPMRRAHVNLRQFQCACAIQKCVLIPEGVRIRMADDCTEFLSAPRSTWFSNARHGGRRFGARPAQLQQSIQSSFLSGRYYSSQ
jgi:hypothetical protein